MGNNKHRIRIEARGYRPALSPIFPRDSGEQVFNARLERGRWLEGTVRGASGEPLEGAEVILASGQGIHISGGKIYQREYHPHQVTGADGRFAFSPPAEDFRIIALHDLGYGEATGDELEIAKGVKVRPWGRIEGSLRVGGRPKAHALDRGPSGGSAGRIRMAADPE